jgi:hypothetical protein
MLGCRLQRLSGKADRSQPLSANTGPIVKLCSRSLMCPLANTSRVPVSIPRERLCFSVRENGIVRVRRWPAIRSLRRSRISSRFGIRIHLGIPRHGIVTLADPLYDTTDNGGSLSRGGWLGCSGLARRLSARHIGSPSRVRLGPDRRIERQRFKAEGHGRFSLAGGPKKFSLVRRFAPTGNWNKKNIRKCINHASGACILSPIHGD